MKRAEDTVIAAVNAWNDGERDEANKLAERAHSEIAQAYQIAKREAALGLDKTAWQQRHFLQEQRRLRSSSK